MKTMKNFATQQLSKKAMNEVKGGISKEEYCATLYTLMQSIYAGERWTAQEWSNAGAAWEAHCM